ncbi:ATP-binding protein [Mucilaginibacter robiniae]|uniref:ATP-binding protein n=1 Tax=Mucilaginibacter robiniae TaxID=2728022 RepID=A0A7L5E7G3_9SPHI|nr:ATP-binding protein [Mucilaginibacter robiniae]QJD98249.1 ATP-binding protein [Mucilaginibacter robiniae]
MEALQVNAVLLANFHIKSVQVDLIIGLENRLIVVEIKGGHLELQGDYNGNWQIKTPTGEWKPTRNYYEQALTAKHVVRDALTLITHHNIGYPEALLLFSPQLNKNSKIVSGDHKVSVKNLQDIKDFTPFKKNFGSTLESCRQLADRLSLEAVEGVNWAISPAYKQIEQQLRNYGKLYRLSYSENLDSFIDFQFRYKEENLSISQINSIHFFQHNLHIVGPSGCGKSMLAQKMGEIALNFRIIPIYLQALHFERQLGPMIDEEVKLLGYNSAANLLKDREQLNYDIVLILDGINECSAVQRAQLVRCVKIMCERFLIRTMIISQENDPLIASLKCNVFEVQLPNHELKKKIAGNVVDHDTLTLIEPLLEIVETGLEARVAGELGKEGASALSRFGLFDLFTRKKLGGNSADGILALDTLAAYLFDQLASSTTERIVERVFLEAGINSSIIDELIDSGILRRYTDRLSFRHEIFLNNYIAESIVRFSKNQRDAVLKALSSPVNFNRKTLILGAVDDTQILALILLEVVDKELIAACFLGECGRFAQQWVKNQFISIFDGIKNEINDFEFDEKNKGLWNTKIKQETLTSWNQSNLAFIEAVPILFENGYFFNDVWPLLSQLDQRNLDALPTMFTTEMKGRDKQDVIDGIFACMYLSLTGSPALAITRIVKVLHNFHSFNNNKKFLIPIREYLRKEPTQSFGQIYIATSFFKLGEDTKLLYPYIFSILSQKWWVAPYHLKLDICWSVGYCWSNELQRLELIDAVNELASHYSSLPTTIFEALQALGATEADEVNYEQVTKKEIENCLANLDDAEYWPMAYAVYYKQFDHPYGKSYRIQLDSLEESELKAILLMALKGSTYDIFASGLVSKLSTFGTVNDCFYLEKFRMPPEELNGFAQERSDLFFITHVVMGQMGYQITSLLGTYESELANTLSGIAECVYNLNSINLNIVERVKRCQIAINFLKRGDSKYVVDGIYWADWAIRSYKLNDSTNAYLQLGLPEMTAFFCRKALSNPGIQKSILFSWDAPEEILQHAIYMLESIGEITDIARLKEFVNHPKLGRLAIEAIQKLERVNTFM